MQTPDLKKKKPQVAKISLQSEQAQPVLNLSENGSLILKEFRLNGQGLKVTHTHDQWDFSLSESTHNLSLENLVTVGQLGQGASGQVEKVQDQVTGQYFAMKKIPVASDPQYLKQLSDELKLALECSSPYVVKCYGAFYKSGTLHIILEYMDVGSIDTLIKKVKNLNEPVMALLLYQILLGIDYLHNKKKIIHRDIKPQNILVNKKGEIKITDFGISGTIETMQQRKTYVGTAVYMSPERLNGEMYGKDSDIWSIGILTTESLMGKHPIQKTQFIDMVNEISTFNIENVQAKISAEMKNFISMCVKLKPEERATVDQLLNHKIILRTKKIDKMVFLQWLNQVTQL
ncbi:unnamed protein product [Paramecium primaurelia]|uniref:Protein kinase domain-containing protein n=2 Tax=Paramecium TaxID=5884 RepID=A0A8S1YNC8_9CILI|nr:unnamed protein product [Paramecium primaurelia]CAD8212942.1 unnamed protein product [Paramecium pentaurelia]